MKKKLSSEAAQRVLYRLKIKGSQTAQQLAKSLDVTPMAVRQHLYLLEEKGFASYYDEARKVGRPARFWQATEKSGVLFPDSHAELAVGILTAVKETFGAEGLQSLVEQRTRQQIERYTSQIPMSKSSLQDRVKALTDMRCEEGYMAEWNRNDDGSFTLAENHCPICSAAKLCQGLCEGELRLFAAVLGDEVDIAREEHILLGERRCLYSISVKQPNSAAKS